VLSEAGVQALWQGMLETAWFVYDEAQQVGLPPGENFPLVYNAGIQSQSARRR